MVKELWTTRQPTSTEDCLIAMYEPTQANKDNNNIGQAIRCVKI